jgi:FAD:protein FMN transferase
MVPLLLWGRIHLLNVPIFPPFAGVLPVQTANKDLIRFSYTEYLMGQDARLVVYAPNEATAQKACRAAFDRIAKLDEMMSDYRNDSELMRLSDGAGGPPVRVSPELFLVLKRAAEVSKLSDGDFDVTVGPVVGLWRKARKTGLRPSASELEKAKQLVGWRMVLLNDKDQTVQLEKPGMRLDLGGIAKGYAADEAQKALKEFGIKQAMVDIGDIVLSDPPARSEGWKIEVPDSNKPEMLLSNCAISSSGDTEQYVIIDGVRYSHVVNPHTGEALRNRVQSTVIAPDGLTSDPLSTATTIADVRTRRRLLRAFPGARWFVRKLGIQGEDAQNIKTSRNP